VIAFVNAIPTKIRVKDVVKPMVEINFLCVSKGMQF
jgi:hypothetical protein